MEKVVDHTPLIIKPYSCLNWQDGVERIADDLSAQGWAVVCNMLPEVLLHRLRDEVCSLKAEGELTQAGVGRGELHGMERSIRRDKTHWLARDTLAQCAFLDQMEQFRQEMNRLLMLGIFSYEAHFSMYEPGAFYKRHFDSFKGAKNRILSTVLYLNHEWNEEDGGALALYETEQEAELPFATILPAMGTLVVFLSENIPHEVMAAHRNRVSIAGWFRCREQAQGAPV